MKTTEEMIAVMTAYNEGKKIESLHKLCPDEGWMEDTLPIWNWNDFDYRVKAEPKYRPYKDANECLVAMLQHNSWITAKNDTAFHLVVTITDTCIWLGNAQIGILMSDLLKEFKFLDDSPCGVLEWE